MNFSPNQLKKELTMLQSSHRRRNRTIAMFLFKLFLLIILIALVTACAFAYGCFRSILDDTPDASAIDLEPAGYATYLYDSEGEIMETLVMAGSNREEVSYNQLPDNLIRAFIAIEDERFWEHKGIDMKGIFRAAFVGFSSGNFSEGASTITQQLIKNNIFEGGSEKTFAEQLVRKIQEQYLALKLEQQLKSKGTIMEYYLNTINLGSNTLGVQAASKKYFAKDVSELTLSECTVLAAITQNPSLYNPITHPDKNAERRELVLSNMKQQGYINQDDVDDALADDVYNRIASNQALADAAGDSVFSYFTDALIDSVVQDLQEELGYTQTQAYKLLYSGGLRIYTTMDPKIQAIAEEECSNPDNYPITEYSITYNLQVTHGDGSTSVYTESDIRAFERQTLGKSAFKLIFDSEEAITACIEEFKAATLAESDTIESEALSKTLQPQASAVVIDPSTGYVAAIVGGRGEKIASRTLNRATDSLRQPGSCFKVLTTFAPAIDAADCTLATTYYDAPYSADGQTFANWWSDTYLGYANIRQAIMCSMNIIATKCINESVGIDTAFSYGTRFGISSLVDSQTINGQVKTDKITALSLGGITYGVSNLELTAAYAAIENGGTYIEPTFYTRICDKDGTILLSKTQESHQVLRESTAELLTSAMEDVITGESPWHDLGIDPTGLPCQVKGLTLAGKSGSTTDSNDVWFEGFSSYYCCGIWSGYDDEKSLGNGQVYHKEIWQKIMSRIHENLKDIPFSYHNLQKATICSKSGLLAIQGVCGCGEDDSVVYEEYFAPGTAPTAYCNRHKVYNICTDSNMLAGTFCPDRKIESKIVLMVDDIDQADGVVTEDTRSSTYEDLYTSTCTIHTHRQPESTPTRPEQTESEPTDEEADDSHSFWNYFHFLFGNDDTDTDTSSSEENPENDDTFGYQWNSPDSEKEPDYDNQYFNNPYWQDENNAGWQDDNRGNNWYSDSWW
ncbi:MAG: transglycosylase domain-containing protein [Lachnospiraceae bacterium]|nr:transglycosylase domain-containing protein [Lachnospiraceae bacterium]